jgi:hypothetical protein
MSGVSEEFFGVSGFNYTTPIFWGKRYKYPSHPSHLSLSDLTRMHSSTEHSRAPLYSPPWFQVRFGEGFEGKLKGEQVRVLVSWFLIPWAPRSSSSRWISYLLLLKLQAPSRLGVTRRAPKLMVCPGTFVRARHSSKWP